MTFLCLLQSEANGTLSELHFHHSWRVVIQIGIIADPVHLQIQADLHAWHSAEIIGGKEDGIIDVSSSYVQLLDSLM